MHIYEKEFYESAPRVDNLNALYLLRNVEDWLSSHEEALPVSGQFFYLDHEDEHMFKLYYMRREDG